MRIDSTLGMIAAEIERSFERAANALQRHRDGFAAVSVLDEARRAIAQVRGALKVADVAGAPRVLLEIEQLLDDTVQGRSNTPHGPAQIAENMARVRAGLDAVRRYVTGLASGAPPRPMALSGTLQDMLVARGSDRPAELELFDANLSRPLPDGVVSDSEQVTDSMRDLRAQFQKGLLDWLNGGANGLRAMRDVVARAHAEAAEPAPWWIAGAFIDHLDSGALSTSVHVKRVFAGLDQYLARLVRGGTAMPESLMREMLYFIALGDTDRSLVAQVRDHYKIAREPLPDTAAPMLSQSESRDLVHALQALWEKSAAGDADSARWFATQIRDAERKLPAPLTPLLETLRYAAEAQAVSGTPLPQLALEVASALLVLEDALKLPGEPPEMADRAAAMAERIRRALQNQGNAAPDWSNLTGDAVSGGARARELLGTLGGELSIVIGTVEQQLAAYFDNRDNAGAIDAAGQALSQAQGVLRVSGDEPAASAAAYCLAEISRLRDLGSAEGRQVQANLAAVVSALAVYVERLGQGDADLAEILRSAGAPAHVLTAQAGEPSGTGGSIDLDLSVFDIELADAAPSQEAPAGDDADWDVASDADLLSVFVEEAGEVLLQLETSRGRLREDRHDVHALSSLRRGFHTLKGSGRMVSLARFAEASYSLERLLDDCIGGGDGADDLLVQLLDAALPRIREWVDELRDNGRVRIDATDPLQWIGTGSADSAVAESPVLPEADDAPTVEIGDVRLSRTLFEVFIGESRRIIEALSAELADLDSTVDGERAHERFRLAHTLCGIAGTTGFSAMRELAGALEAVLGRAHENTLVFETADATLFESVTAALQEMVDAIESRQPPQGRGDLVAELRAIAQHRGNANAAAEGDWLDDSEQSASPALHAAPVGPALQAAVKVLAEQLSETGVLEVMPAAHAERRRLRMQDDIDNTLLPAFLEEAADLVPQIGEALRNWRADPQRHDAHQALTRLMHTFKGGARMAGAMALGELTHSMETRIATAARLPLVPDSVFDGLEISFDRMGVLLERISRSRQVTAPDDLSQTSPGVESPAPAPVGRSAGAEPTDIDAGMAPAGPVRGAATTRPLLRVRVDLLERLAAEAGELAISRSRVEGEMRSMRGMVREMAASIIRLRAQVREMEIQAESQIQSRQVQADETAEALDPLELDRFTRLQELTRLIDESANDAASLHQSIARNIDSCDGALAAQARMTRILQDSLVSVRMVAFASLNERLYRVVRLTARDAGKRASLDIRGSRVELDRGVVDRIAAPLEHLLRNAVVHGIEPADERRAAGKPDAGEIILEIRQEGNEVLINLQDDGRGFDLERLRARAVEAGLIAAGSEPSPDEIAQLAFAPGVTTAGEVSESAGRGVGLDVVRSEVLAVGGRVEVSFEPRRGTVFTMRLPQTMTVMQSLVVRSAGRLFAIPAMMVEQVRTLKPQALERIRQSGEVEWQANRYPFHELRELLAIGTQAREPQAFSPIALVRGGAQRAAIGIDELVAHEEVVMKDIGRQLAAVTGIVGAAVRGSGEIVLILNPVSLVQRQPSAPVQLPGAAGDEGKLPVVARVLVVDDSLTVRKITGRVLTRGGYRVTEARDGLEALDCLSAELPELVLLDVEMPRMDGFEVLRRMRADPRWRSIPVMVITSRTADKHRNHAFELGANAFLGKPFEEQELLAQVAELTEQERV